MMNPLIVAVNAKYIHPNNTLTLLKANSAYTVDTIAFTIKDDSSSIINHIITTNPLFVGFSCYIWNIEKLKPIIRRLKEATNIPIVLGGPEVSYDAKYFIETLSVDLIVKGEGEHIIDAVIEHYKFGKTLANTPSITTPKIDNPIQEIKSLTTLKTAQSKPLKDATHKVHYIESSRGCPYQCSYCLSSLEKRVRFFSEEQVQNDILSCIKQGAKTIKFLDRTFNANPKAKALIDFIIKHHQPGMSFQFEITGDTMDQSLVEHIHQHAPKHLFRFEIGIQSTYDKTNLAVDRNQNNQKLIQMLNTIISADIIDCHLDLIAGLPYEALNRFKQTFNEIYELKAKELQLGFLKMLRGTKIRRQAEYYDYRYHEEAPYEIIDNHVLTKQDITTIKQVETMLNMFHNKNYFNTNLQPIIKQITTDYFSFFLELYAYHTKHYPLKHYQVNDIFASFYHFLKIKDASDSLLDDIKYLYLKRANIKPPCFFNRINDKTKKQTILNALHQQTGISLNALYKHSILTPYKNRTLIAYYQHHQVTMFTL